MYWIKRKIWQIRNVIKWLPVIWNQFDFDYRYSIDVFKFQLQKTADHLNSDNAYTLSAKDNARRLQTIIDLMDKVYEEEYGIEYFDEDSELDFTTFSKLCLFAMILRRPEVIELLDKKYGCGGWQKQYKDHYHGKASGLENAIYEAQGRSLEIYNK